MWIYSFCVFSLKVSLNKSSSRLRQWSSRTKQWTSRPCYAPAMWGQSPITGGLTTKRRYALFSHSLPCSLLTEWHDRFTSHSTSPSLSLCLLACCDSGRGDVLHLLHGGKSHYHRSGFSGQHCPSGPNDCGSLWWTMYFFIILLFSLLIAIKSKYNNEVKTRESILSLQIE